MVLEEVTGSSVEVHDLTKDLLAFVKNLVVLVLVEAFHSFALVLEKPSDSFGELVPQEASVPFDPPMVVVGVAGHLLGKVDHLGFAHTVDEAKNFEWTKCDLDHLWMHSLKRDFDERRHSS